MTVILCSALTVNPQAGNETVSQRVRWDKDEGLVGQEELTRKGEVKLDGEEGGTSPGRGSDPRMEGSPPGGLPEGGGVGPRPRLDVGGQESHIRQPSHHADSKLTPGRANLGLLLALPAYM